MLNYVWYISDGAAKKINWKACCLCGGYGELRCPANSNTNWLSVVMLKQDILRACQTSHEVDLFFYRLPHSLSIPDHDVMMESSSVEELLLDKGGGPRVVVSTAAFHARVWGSVPGFGGLKETKNVSSPSTCESQYCGEPLWPRGSVLGLRPPGLEFRILCLEDSVISIISPSSGGSPGPG